MSEKMTGESKIKTSLSLEEIQRQLAVLQEQVKVITTESSASADTRKEEAISTLYQLPHDAKKPIAWSYGGSYRPSAGNIKKRISLWTTSIDDFINSVPDTAIVQLASLFTNPTVVAILRQLIEGNRTVTELAHGCDISESEIEKAVRTLIDANLAVRTEDNLIEPKNDAIAYFMNFVGMTRVHLNPKEH